MFASDSSGLTDGLLARAMRSSTEGTTLPDGVAVAGIGSTGRGATSGDGATWPSSGDTHRVGGGAGGGIFCGPPGILPDGVVVCGIPISGTVGCWGCHDCIADGGSGVPRSNGVTFIMRVFPANGGVNA